MTRKREETVYCLRNTNFNFIYLFVLVLHNNFQTSRLKNNHTIYCYVKVLYQTIGSMTLCKNVCLSVYVC